MSGPASEGGPGETQLLVRATMLAAGGYWRPLAAVARLLEELGELAELLAFAVPPPRELAGELADLWIITTALADQYLAVVSEPASAQSGSASLGALVAAAGPIGRIVNHYDGPKTPRPGAGMPSLSRAIAAFHAQLGALAGALETDLAVAVADKLMAIRARGDLTRFERSGHDPSTAGVLDRYRQARGGEGLAQRLWGAPESRGEDPASLAATIAPWLDAFAKAAPAEGFDGFVVPGPAMCSPQRLESWAAELLSELGADGEGRLELVRQGLQLSARPWGRKDGESFLLLSPASDRRR